MSIHETGSIESIYSIIANHGPVYAASDKLSRLVTVGTQNAHVWKETLLGHWKNERTIKLDDPCLTPFERSRTAELLILRLEDQERSYEERRKNDLRDELP